MQNSWFRPRVPRERMLARGPAVVIALVVLRTRRVEAVSLILYEVMDAGLSPVVIAEGDRMDLVKRRQPDFNLSAGQTLGLVDAPNILVEAKRLRYRFLVKWASRWLLFF